MSKARRNMLNYFNFILEKGRNHFEMLPEGWLQVTHISGMPIYLHRQSRVCSASKPYFLGPGSVRVSICVTFAIQSTEHKIFI